MRGVALPALALVLVLVVSLAPAAADKPDPAANNTTVDTAVAAVDAAADSVAIHAVGVCRGLPFGGGCATVSVDGTTPPAENDTPADRARERVGDAAADVADEIDHDSNGVLAPFAGVWRPLCVPPLAVFAPAVTGGW